MRNRSFCLFGLATIVSACGGAGSGEWDTASQGLNCPGITLALGIDSVNNSVCSGMNWTQFKQGGGSFALIKATEGDWDGTSGWQYVNANFPSAWPAMKQAGVVRGAYSYLHVDLDGARQARYLYNVVNQYGGWQPGDAPPMLDLEQMCPGDAASCSNPIPQAQAQQVAQDFLNTIESLTGMVPFIYTYDWYWVSYFGAPSSFGKYPVFWASCTCNDCNYCSTCPSQNTAVAPAAPWTRSTFWQYNWNAANSPGFPGVPNGCADTSAFNGTPAELQAWVMGQWPGGPSQLTSNDALTVVNWPGDDEVEVFAKTTAGNAMHVYTNPTTSDTWTQDYALTGTAECGLSAVMWPPPRGYFAELFDPTASGSTQHLWWSAGSGWNAFGGYGAPSGVSLSKLSTIAWNDGHTEVFGLGSDGQIWHNYWNYSSNAWSGWLAFGGAKLVTTPSPIMWSDGHGEVFSTDDTGAVWHTWSGSGTGFTQGWHSWVSLGGSLASRAVPVRWADGHVQVFGRGTDDVLYEAHSTSSGSGWSSFAAINAGSTIQGDPSAIVNVSGKGGSPGPEIFARDSSNQVVHAWWNGTAWTAWGALLTQTAASDPFGWIRTDGSTVVFAVDPSGQLMKTYHDPSKGWTAWAALGSGIDACVPAPPPGPDAGAPDAGQRGGDAGTAGGDGGSSSGADAGGPELVHGGCGCMPADGVAPFAGLPFALALSWRLRRKRVSR